MSFVVINGLIVEITDAQEEPRIEVGERVRTLTGRLRSTVRASRRVWRVRTFPLSRALEQQLRGYATGQALVTVSGGMIGGGALSAALAVDDSDFVARDLDADKAITLHITEVGAASSGIPDAAQSVAVVPNVGIGQTRVIRVQAIDASGAFVIVGGAVVAGTMTGAHPHTLVFTDQGDGTYTATDVPATAGTDFVSLTINGGVLGGSPYTSVVTSGVVTVTGSAHMVGAPGAVAAINAPGSGGAGNIVYDPVNARQTLHGFGGSILMYPELNATLTTQIRAKLLDYGAQYLRIICRVGASSGAQNPSVWQAYPGAADWSDTDWRFTKWVVPMRTACLAAGDTFRLLVDVGGSGMNGMATSTYAQMVVDYFNHITQVVGSPEPDFVAIKNEPDNGAVKTPQEIAAFAIALMPALRAAGYNTVKLSSPMLEHGANARQYLIDMLAVAGFQPSWLGTVSYHNYSTPMTNTDRNALRNYVNSLGLGIFTEMNEHNSAPYTEMLDDIANAGAAGWMKDGLAGPHATNPWVTTDGISSIADTPGFDYLWVIHRHVRAGMQYIPATCPTDNTIFPYMFLAANGDKVLVVRTTSNSRQIHVAGMPAGTYYPHYTTVSQSKVTGTGITIAAGQLLNFTMPASGVVALTKKA